MHDSVMCIASRPPWVECLLPQEQTAGPGLLRHPPLLIGVLIVVVSQSFTLRKYYTLYLANLLFKCRLESHKAHVCMCNTLYSAGLQQRKVTPRNNGKQGIFIVDGVHSAAIPLSGEGWSRYIDR